MRFPIIKVYDRRTKKEHIVGTNIHDVLEIEEGQTIRYFNYQNGEGTGKHGDYRFVGVGENNNPFESVKVEFVTLEELKQIYKEFKKKSKESEQIKEKIFDLLGEELKKEDDRV